MDQNARDELLKQLSQYENQLSQVKLAVSATPSGSEKDDLIRLQTDIEELISLTKEQVNQNKTEEKSDGNALDKEYALFKLELEELDNQNSSHDDTDGQATETALPNIEEELATLKGSKCQAPHKQKWGDVSYHNALVMSVDTSGSPTEMEHIKVRVLFVNPTEREMMPCPYLLEGSCKYSDDQCHYSHGELVPFSDLREYREPDFSLIREQSQVLAKHKDKLWHRAVVLAKLSNGHYRVKYESKGGSMAELDLHDMLPLETGERHNSDSGVVVVNLDSSDDDSETLDDDDDDGDDVDNGDNNVNQNYFTQLSLLRVPGNNALGEWEKHTKGIGSRLMAKMGYIHGCGLGKLGEGRLEPVEAQVFPPGKSLDHCMALREAAGGDADLFKAERKQRVLQRKMLKRLQNEYEKEKEREKSNVFSFLNSTLSGSNSSAEPSNSVNLTKSTSKGLNVERFKVGEDIRRAERDMAKLRQSLTRHSEGSIAHTAIKDKLRQAQGQLDKLQDCERSIIREQSHRENKKKLAVF